MRLNILKISVLSILSVLAVLMIAGAAFFWRLSSGPVSMSFLNGKIESAINAQLSAMKVTLGDAVLELDKSTYVPHVQFQNLILRDSEGTVLASAPRAAVTLDSEALLSGKIVATSLELIGPKISARRNLDGTIVLGVGGQADVGEVLPAGKGDIVADQTSAPNQSSGAKLVALLAAPSGKETLSTLQNIRISQAALSVFDDANGATWNAPQADLTFQKLASGFQVLAKADVASAGAPWHAEISTNYDREKHIFDVNTTVDNLVPANVAEKIFALSQFAKVKIPLSGHIEFSVGEDGVVRSGNAELLASAGEVNLPDYLARPITVDEGNLRVKYDAVRKSFIVDNSSILVGGERADVTGSIEPVRATDGRLTELKIALKANNVNVNAQDNSKTSILVDHVEFSGKASVEQARLDIDDLVVMSGNSGVRMRGIITGGDKSPGIQLAGRVRDLSADMVKQLWPPIVAPKSRNWVTEHVVDGRVSEGTFQINLPVNTLHQALADRHIPDGSIDLTFSLRDVSTHYFKSLPLLEHASAEAHQKDNDFELNITAGQSVLSSGKIVNINKGSFSAHNLLLEEVPGSVTVDLTAPIAAMLELANQPDLNLIKSDFKTMPKLTGIANASIGLQFPLIKDVPKSRLQMTTAVSISGATVDEILPGVNLTDGELAVAIGAEKITVSGPAKVNGLPAKISWEKPRGGGPAVSKIEAILDEQLREKIGIKLSTYLSGPMPVQATISQNEAGENQVDVDADLSSVKMKLAALGWKRDAVEGTTASFSLTTNNDGSRNVNDFKLDGDGLRLRGNIDIAKNGKLSSVTMDEIRLDQDNVFSAKVVPGDGTTDLTVNGKNFDARPYIKNLISPVQTGANAAPQSQSGADFTLTAHFDHVTANRGEAVDDVSATLRARAGKIAEADITGHFLSGQPITIKVTPLPEGRDLRVDTNDGGAAIRAANFYSKMAGGTLQFAALIGNEQGSPVRNGRLLVQNFAVRNEAALAQLDQRGKPKKSGPRSDGLTFKKLWLPFTIDGEFVRMGDVILRGSDMCATASGVIRKADGALDITGTVVPVCGLTGVFNNVPLIGDILTGGNNNEGIFGMTYAMSGSLAKPNVRVNPVSVLAPGLFRRFFDFQKNTSGVKPLN